MTLDELRTLCVDRFPTSLSRVAIMDGLEKIIRLLVDAQVDCDIWVDGSFLTEKIDPGDVDILLRVSSAIYDNDEVKRSVVDAASDPGLSETHSCDSYKCVEYLAGHPLYREADKLLNRWREWFGKSRTGKPKGMAIIRLRS